MVVATAAAGGSGSERSRLLQRSRSVTSRRSVSPGSRSNRQTSTADNDLGAPANRMPPPTTTLARQPIACRRRQRPRRTSQSHATTDHDLGAPANRMPPPPVITYSGASVCCTPTEDQSPSPANQNSPTWPRTCLDNQSSLSTCLESQSKFTHLASHLPG